MRCLAEIYVENCVGHIFTIIRKQKQLVDTVDLSACEETGCVIFNRHIQSLS